METILSFGTFSTSPDQTFATYTAPGRLPEELINRIYRTGEAISESPPSDNSEVTHGRFFGENIQRIKETLFPGK